MNYYKKEAINSSQWVNTQSKQLIIRNIKEGCVPLFFGSKNKIVQ